MWGDVEVVGCCAWVGGLGVGAGAGIHGRECEREDGEGRVRG